MSIRSTSAAAFLLIGALFAQTTAPVKLKDIDLKVDPLWYDTEIDVEAGETIRISATGSLEVMSGNNKVTLGPAGLKRGLRDLVKTYMANEANRAAVVARIGTASAARPFLVGPKWEGKTPIAGRLFLGINQSGAEAATGSFKVSVERIAEAPELPKDTDLKLPKVTQAIIDQVPPRVSDAAGTQGDRVNFMIVGSRARVIEAFQLAGWVQVDKDSKSAILKGVMDTLSQRSYVSMPMSELMLFGRVQDFGYAQGDPVKVVATRHHFRLWQAPFDLDGHTIWAGAGTHDIGFDKDQRTGGLTHKIDPEVDGEREYIAESLRHTGLVVSTEYLTAKDAITKAKTAHGEEFSSDGRTIIIYLQP
jgi:hypothetical protein